MPQDYSGLRDLNHPLDSQMDNPKVVVDPNKKSTTSTKDSGIASPDFKMAMRLYQQGRQVRKAWDQDWDKQERWYKGNQWDWRRPSYKASPAMNILRANVQTMLPILTDTSPSFDITPQEPSDNDFADLLNKLIDNWWQRRNMQIVLTYSLLDMMIFDACGVIKCVWNDDLDGIGDIECTRIDPRNIFVDQDATDFTDAKFVIEEKWLPVSELRLKFPDKQQFIRGGRSAIDPRKQVENQLYSGQINLQSPIDQDVPLQAQGESDKNTSSTAGDIKTMKVLEVWIRDETLDEIETEKTDGSGGKETILKKRYPRGRLITILPDNGVLLQAVDNPYGDGKFPYVRFVDSVRPGCFWGEGEVGPLIETQKLINKVGATITDWCNRMTNAVWILDDDSGVNPSMLTNQVGLILSKRRGTEVRREAAPNLPSEVFEFYQLLMKLSEMQSGIHDVTQGRKPTGVTAAAAISEMQDAAQTRIRLKERNMQSALVQLGYMIVNRMLQFYETPRTVRITGDQGWPEFYEVWFTKTEQEQFILNHKSYQFAPGTRQFVPVTDWQQTSPSKGEFDIMVQAGTSLPFMKQRRSQLAFQLYNAQAIDQEALLKAVDWPNYQEVMRRMNDAAQAAAQSQAQAQAAANAIQPAPAPPMAMGGTPAEQTIPVMGG